MSTTIETEATGAYVTVACGPMIGNRPTIWLHMDTHGGDRVIRLWPEEARKIAAALMAHAPSHEATDAAPCGTCPSCEQGHGERCDRVRR